MLGALAGGANPHIDYLGIEVHRAGVGPVVAPGSTGESLNVRIVCHDAVEVLKLAIQTRPSMKS